MLAEIQHAIGILTRIKTGLAHQAHISGNDAEIMDLEQDLQEVTRAIDNLDETSQRLKPQQPVYVGGD